MWQPWLKSNGKYELVNIKDGYIKNKSGLTSKDIEIINKFVAYMNYNIKSDLPIEVIEDIDYIKSKGANYCPCNIKIPLF